MILWQQGKYEQTWFQLQWKWPLENSKIMMEGSVTTSNVALSSFSRYGSKQFMLTALQK